MAGTGRLRPALKFAAAAIVLYLMLASVLMSTYDFIRYGAFPAALIVVALGILYGVRRRDSSRRSSVRVLVDAPPGSDPARDLEARLDQYREAASRDPSRMPQLALRLLALSSLYEGRDPGQVRVVPRGGPRCREVRLLSGRRRRERGQGGCAGGGRLPRRAPLRNARGGCAGARPALPPSPRAPALTPTWPGSPSS
ncbi:hypothetical protein [Conexivisphaera calida]|uniref:Uncharacterized protein n=1 Tax=Conexivisphaera calida TaxID=1874277 RepID=A0A4P2VF34_9ARCH|nr:hypothetical protein [Conexivisphaera calida]BBE42083.1 hypothetical protein NAS2_0694 [Conexivisphaera calida]